MLFSPLALSRLRSAARRRFDSSSETVSCGSSPPPYRPRGGCGVVAKNRRYANTNKFWWPPSSWIFILSSDFSSAETSTARHRWSVQSSNLRRKCARGGPIHLLFFHFPGAHTSAVGILCASGRFKVPSRGVSATSAACAFSFSSDDSLFNPFRLRARASGTPSCRACTCGSTRGGSTASGTAWTPCRAR